MKAIARFYTNQVKDNFVTLFANWIPESPLSLGDFGVLDGNIFIRKGNVRDFGLNFETITGPSVDEKFTSGGAVDVAFNAKATVPATGATVNANITIDFHKEHSIYFSAEGCSTSSIKDKNTLGNEVLKLYEDGKWKKEHTIVTDVVVAERSIVVISEGNNCKYVLEADANVSKIEVNTNLAVTTSKSVGYSVDAKKGLNILMGLCKIKNKFPFWNGPSFEDIKLQGMALDVKQTIEDAPEFKTENSNDELFFGQLGL